MSTVPRLTYRYERFAELIVYNKTDVRAYRFGAADTLDVAFVGTTPMFTVPTGGTFQSPSIRKRKIGRSLYENRGLTAVHYDPEDYWVGGGTLPHDAAGGYLRVSEQDQAGVWRPEGPILIVPPPGFFSTTRPNLTVKGTAPNVAGTTTGVPPAGALHYVLPRFSDSATFTNNGLASIFISFSAGLPEFEVVKGGSTLLPDAAVSDVFIRGSGGAIPFSVFHAIVNAEMA